MAKKTFVLAISLLLTLVLCSIASAERQAFTDFSLDIPAGWTATEETDAKGAKTVVINNAAKKITIMLGYENLDGKTLKDKANELSTATNGQLVEIDAATYVVTFKDANGVDNIAFLGVEDANATRFMGFGVIGGASAMQDPEVDAIMNSLEEKK